MRLEVEFCPQTLSVDVKSETYSTEFQNPIARDYVEREPYTGAYEITPSGDLQILSTKNLRMTDNITINPVPSNYGRIDWNGQYLTVS